MDRLLDLVSDLRSRSGLLTWFSLKRPFLFDRRLFIDVCLGCLSLVIILHTPFLDFFRIDMFDDFVDWLRGLLLWLMDNPAGLKLNQPLNDGLGGFFLYHVYLWRTYVSTLLPSLHALTPVVYLSSALGLSFQLALLCDTLSILLIHIYCFHIYAARIYQFALTCLSSLWRLFRGRKYNPLRDRVDTAHYTPEQLFVGSIGFTLTVFLLPTVLVYYVVG